MTIGSGSLITVLLVTQMYWSVGQMYEISLALGEKAGKLKKIWMMACRNSFNEGESAVSFCWQVAALFPDMFCNFYLVKSHKIAKNSTATKAREKKNKHRFGILRILEYF